jgi:hypothetical protein
MNGDDHAGLDSCARMLEHFDAVPVEGRRVLRASQAMAPDHMVEVASSKRGLDVGRITLGEENGTTEHKAMTLPKRKVTAQGMENRSC